tara:strand:+ start:289 stop:1155 length:867 start_codon:yes stop_codon:yes gene_type:complete
MLIVKNIQKLLQRLLFQNYKLSLIDKDSLKEKQISDFYGYHILSFIAYLFLTSFILSFFLFGYTLFKELLPERGVIKNNKIIELIIRVDSLERDLILKREYINMIHQIVQGEVLESIYLTDSDSTLLINEGGLKPSKDDSILRQEVIDADLYNIPVYRAQITNSIEDFIFYKPIEGIIINELDINDKHFGLDIAAAKNSSVKSCLDGIVLFSDWSSSKGNVVIIQHIDNIVSTYMHNSILFKESGEFVKAGEVIGVVGNSGEQTTGPHLHFELWQNGTPINPADYIDF